MKDINSNLQSMKEDHLYHLGIHHTREELKEKFGDVRFVCMGGTEHRMESFAKFLVKELNYKLPTGACLENLSLKSHRFAMYKVGPVISVSHGMGKPSLSILMNEIIKLLHYAEAVDPIFLRIGTSGGLGHDPGTVIVTKRPMTPDLSNKYKTLILGKERLFPAILDDTVAKELLELGEQLEFKTESGDTVCCNDFYEGQGRLDGPFCDYEESDKMSYLTWLKKNGVSNIEMEATAFGAITHRAGLRGGIVCVTFLDRLNGDQVTVNKEDLEEWQLRPQKLVAAYIKKTLGLH